jgi:hypothetical protein
MATTKMWAVHSRLDHLVDYVSNKSKTINTEYEDLKAVIEYASENYKTEKRFYVSAINCNPETACDSMMLSQQKNDKELRVLAYHGYQSFAEGEVTAETAHEIGVKLATELWGDKFQVIVATHLNTNHYHNHFVLCSTSYLDGKRFHACTKSYMDMRTVSDRLCKEYSLSVIDNPQRGKTKHYAEIKAEIEGKSTWRGNIRSDIDRAIEQSTTTRHFWEAMEALGYEIKKNVKYLAVRPQGHTKFFRLYKLGDNYTPESIKERILENIRRKLPFPEDLMEKKPYRFVGNLKKARKLTGLRALYYNYCYKLGVFPKNRASNKRMHFLLREDLIKLDSIIAQSKLLSENRIDTHEQLAIYKSSVEEKIEKLAETRKVLRNQLKCLVRNNDEFKDIDVKGQISDISVQLKKLYIENKLCNGIFTRSALIKENLSQVKFDEIKQGKEQKDYEHIRRSSRPNR